MQKYVSHVLIFYSTATFIICVELNPHIDLHIFDMSSKKNTLRVDIPYYNDWTETQENGKWSVSFRVNIPDIHKNIIPCDSVVIREDHVGSISMDKPAMMRTLLNYDGICYPDIITFSGSLVLLLQDMTRHPGLYARRKKLKGMTVMFVPCFSLLIEKEHCAMFVHGERKFYLRLEIMMMYSSLVSLSSCCLNPVMRLQHITFLSHSRDNRKSKHVCDNFSVKATVSPLKDICSIKVCSMLNSGTDVNRVLCSAEIVSELELPWTLTENLMSERCALFQPLTVAKLHPRWNCETMEAASLSNVSICRNTGETDACVLIETDESGFGISVWGSVFRHVQDVMMLEGGCSWQCTTEEVTGERLNIAITALNGEGYLFLWTTRNDIMQLRQLYMNKHHFKAICEMSFI